MSDNHNIIEAHGLSKYYGPVRALENVDFELKEGEVLGLLGDNGAGKSTLIKILSGAITPNKGEIYFEGKVVHITQPRDAFSLGIETIYQDLALFNNLNFTQNIFVGREYKSRRLGKIFGSADDKRMRKEATEKITVLSINLPQLDQKIETLSGGQRQAVAITRAIFWGKKVIIMDEPTAALGVRESTKVMDLIKEIRNHVKGIIIIAHNVEHVIKVADRVIVLRHGERVGTINFSEYKDKDGNLKHGELHNDIVKLITGF
jgi:ABC-type sugar transport system ATPase subunit